MKECFADKIKLIIWQEEQAFGTTDKIAVFLP